MTRSAWVLAGLTLLACGALLGLYGLFAILYTGDSGGSADTYVKLGGHEIDADVVGGIALLLALCLISVGMLALERPKRFFKRF